MCWFVVCNQVHASQPNQSQAEYCVVWSQTLDMEVSWPQLWQQTLGHIYLDKPIPNISITLVDSSTYNPLIPVHEVSTTTSRSPKTFTYVQSPLVWDDTQTQRCIWLINNTRCIAAWQTCLKKAEAKGRHERLVGIHWLSRHDKGW